MKTLKFRIVGSIFILCSVAAAQDAAAIYKSKCASCHGATGAGRPAMKGSDLHSDNAKNMSDADMEDVILNGGTKKLTSHAFANKGVSPADAKALVAYIRELQK
jgi:mono/diheme cytochrome c family protein